MQNSTHYFEVAKVQLLLRYQLVCPLSLFFGILIVFNSNFLSGKIQANFDNQFVFITLLISYSNLTIEFFN